MFGPISKFMVPLLLRLVHGFNTRTVPTSVFLAKLVTIALCGVGF